MLADELTGHPDDIVVTKRNWGAFHGTDLDVQLRRRGVTQIVLGGIATSMGVESTARAAHEHGYHVTLATDAMADMVRGDAPAQRRADLPAPRRDRDDRRGPRAARDETRRTLTRSRVNAGSSPGQSARHRA